MKKVDLQDRRIIFWVVQVAARNAHMRSETLKLQVGVPVAPAALTSDQCGVGYVMLTRQGPKRVTIMGTRRPEPSSLQ